MLLLIDPYIILDPKRQKKILLAEGKRRKRRL